MKTENRTIVYATREIERALGMPPGGRYRIVSNRTPYGESVKERWPDHVTLIESPDGAPLGTGDLLNHPGAGELIDAVKAAVLVFKNTARIEAVVREHGWTLLNPPAAVSEKIENKVSQVSWLRELASYLPPHQIQTAKAIEWRGAPFIVQWAHGHTGRGTTLVDAESVLKDLQAKFPERRARVTGYVPGPSFTVNAVVDERTIAPGNISYQITGMKPFTDSRFATVGNDWGAAQMLLDDTDIKTVQEIVDKIGARMQKDGWRGLFGIDLIKDAATGRLFLIEINARQPASAPFESSLQGSKRAEGASGMTIFEAHMAALVGEPLQPIIHITDGAQIVQRVTEGVKSIPEGAADSLKLAGYETVSYANAELGADLIRIQSANSIMAGHDAFDERGKEIAAILFT